MMKILIVYGTTEGQTRKIADFVAEHMRDRGETVTLVDSTDVPKGLEAGDHDAVVVAGSVHNGRHQASLFQFVRDNRPTLQRKPTAFLSVSLSMASEDAEDRLDAAACADRFIEAAGWQPTVTHLVAGALRYTQYDFFKSWILKMIASAKGASTDTSQDHEFTDWDDLKAFADAFLAAVAGHEDQSGPPEGKARIHRRKIGTVRAGSGQAGALNLEHPGKDGPMTTKTTAESHPSIDRQAVADWQQAYMGTAAALGASWCDFVGERFHAYAHMIDDVAHCHDLNEAWKVQSTFGQQAFRAYSDQAQKVSGLVMQAAKGDGAVAKP